MTRDELFDKVLELLKGPESGYLDYLQTLVDISGDYLNIEELKDLAKSDPYKIARNLIEEGIIDERYFIKDSNPNKLTFREWLKENYNLDVISFSEKPEGYKRRIKASYDYYLHPEDYEESEEIKLKDSPMTITVQCYIFDGDKILIQDRPGPIWKGLAVPGGHIKFEEDIKDGCIREVKEETGLDLNKEKLELFGTHQYVCDEEGECVALLYKTSDYKGDLKSSEEGEMKWMKVEDVLKSDRCAEDLPKLLDAAYNNKTIGDSKIGDIIKKTDKGYEIYSHTGKRLSKPYKTKKEAEERLKEIEMFKHMKKDALMKPELSGKKIKIIVNNALSSTIDRMYGQDIISREVKNKNEIEYILPYDSRFDYLNNRFHKKYSVIDSYYKGYDIEYKGDLYQIWKDTPEGDTKIAGDFVSIEEAKEYIDGLSAAPEVKKPVYHYYDVYYIDYNSDQTYVEHSVKAKSPEDAKRIVKRMYGKSIYGYPTDAILVQDSGKKVKDMKNKTKDSVDDRYRCESYFDNKGKGLEDSRETNDIELAKDWIMKKVNQGYLSRIIDKKTGEVWIFDEIEDLENLSEVQPANEEDLVEMENENMIIIYRVEWFDKKGYKHIIEFDDPDDAKEYVESHQDEDHKNLLLREENRDLQDSVKESEPDQYIYQFPSSLTKEDLSKLENYNLKYLGTVKVDIHGEIVKDILIQGSKKDLERYADEWLDYQLHPDFLWKVEEEED